MTSRPRPTTRHDIDPTKPTFRGYVHCNIGGSNNILSPVAHVVKSFFFSCIVAVYDVHKN